MRLQKYTIALLALLFFAILIVGCASYPSGETFPDPNKESIKTGMDAQELEDILGKPYVVERYIGGEKWIWSYALKGTTHAFAATIEGGKVISLSEFKESN